MSSILMFSNNSVKLVTLKNRLVLEATETNLVSRTGRVSGELGITQSSVVCHLHNVSKSIRSRQILPYITKILKNFWVTLEDTLQKPINPRLDKFGHLKIKMRVPHSKTYWLVINEKGLQEYRSHLLKNAILYKISLLHLFWRNLNQFLCIMMQPINLFLLKTKYFSKLIKKIITGFFLKINF